MGKAVDKLYVIMQMKFVSSISPNLWQIIMQSEKLLVIAYQNYAQKCAVENQKTGKSLSNTFLSYWLV